MNIDHQAVEALLRQAANEEILPLWQNLRKHQIEHKHPGDLVTAADKPCEKFLTRELSSLLPGSLVIGEEAAHRDTGIMVALASDLPVWVVDPLDGTGNFAAGVGPIAIMVCLVQQRQTLAAWIFDPVEDTLLQAERSAGTLLNGNLMKISAHRGAVSAIQGALSTRYLPEELRHVASEAAQQLGKTRASGCAGYDYRALVNGDYQFVFYYRTLVWDHAPGVLITQEAGGHCGRYNGSNYKPVAEGSGLIGATDPRTWEILRNLLVPSESQYVCSS